jgi:hypothetical protein
VSARTEVLLWAQRVLARKGGPAHILMELKETATPDDAQEAFHKIARFAHPDLHRHGLNADELELVTSAYAAVAGAYMELRSRAKLTRSPAKPAARTDDTPAAPAAAAPARTPPGGSPAAPPPPASSSDGDAGAGIAELIENLSPANAAQHMAAKAIPYARKAEAALKRGDLKSALLQLKLAVSADGASAFLRSALAEVDAELRKTA